MGQFAFLIENWFVIVVIICVAGVCGSLVGGFFKMPKEEQIKKIKKWLLQAVVQAEIELGNGTGKIKLSQVYDLFVQRFPDIAKMITFDMFSVWVDETLKEMEKMIQSNKKVRDMVARKSEK